LQRAGAFVPAHDVHLLEAKALIAFLTGVDELPSRIEILVYGNRYGTE
jgi:hypothetical protein